LAKEREEKGLNDNGGGGKGGGGHGGRRTKGSAGFAGEGGGLDTSHVVKLIEEKKQGLPNMLLPVDITIVLKLHHEQAISGNLMVNKIRLMANR